MRYRYWTTTIFSKKSAVKNKTSLIICGILFLVLGLPAYSQTERWVFRYNGPADSADVALSLVYGADGNIYTAGYSQNTGTGSDFIVTSLNKDTGDTNWVYRYNGPADSADCANSIVYGNDGNIYAAGYSRGIGTEYDLTVISLTTAGTERWVYRYNNPIDSNDVASSIVYGSDGSLYVAGWVDATEYLGYPQYQGKYFVISLTSTGSQRWTYQYIGPYGDRGEAHSIVYGADGNIYTAGWSWGTYVTDYTRFTVISLTTAGAERWVHADSEGGVANSLVFGGDGNIYTAGYFTGVNYDIGIVSLTASGDERWNYCYSGPPGSSGDDLDEIRSIVYGADGNIYAAGVSDSTDWTNLTPAFTVISLTLTGSQRWVYRYYSGAALARSIAYGADNNLYATGYCFQGSRAFGVICLTPAGGERWIYRYNTPYVDEAYAVIYGADRNVYAAGFSESRNTPFAQDILVVSLDPETGVNEEADTRIYKDTFLSISTMQTNKLCFSLSFPKPTLVRLSLYNIIGEKVLSWVISAPEGTSHHSKSMSAISTGIYILKVKTSKKDYDEARKIIYVE